VKTLIPILSKREGNEAFLKKATAKSKEIILLLVIDTRSSMSSGFTATEISQGQKIMKTTKEKIGKMRKACETLLEWGDTFTRIDHTAKLRRANTVALLKQDNQFFKELVEFLKKQKAYKVIVIEAPQKEENEKKPAKKL